MSLTLNSNESINTKCQLQEFTAILTNLRLVITTPISEVNFPLRSICGIEIYDDVEKHKKDFKSEKTKIKRKYFLIPFAIGYILCFIAITLLQALVALTVIIIGVLVGVIAASFAKPDVKLQSVLTITKQGGLREFRFYKTDSNTAEMKKFIDHVTETFD